MARKLGRDGGRRGRGRGGIQRGERGKPEHANNAVNCEQSGGIGLSGTTMKEERPSRRQQGNKAKNWAPTRVSRPGPTTARPAIHLLQSSPLPREGRTASGRAAGKRQAANSTQGSREQEAGSRKQGTMRSATAGRVPLTACILPPSPQLTPAAPRDGSQRTGAREAVAATSDMAPERTFGLA